MWLSCLVVRIEGKAYMLSSFSKRYLLQRSFVGTARYFGETREQFIEAITAGVLTRRRPKSAG
jgi:hypothetical protein